MTTAVGITATSVLGLALLDAVGLQPGGRVLDVGCGRGDITLAAARRVGRSGLALGVEASLTMLEEARRRAADAGLAHVGFVHADAQTQRFAPLRFDAIVSERGLDAFADPAAGIANLARALRAGSQLAVLSRDDPDAVPAVLTPVGFVDVDVARAHDVGAWIVSARASG